jgi:hypothetical protein
VELDRPGRDRRQRRPGRDRASLPVRHVPEGDDVAQPLAA